ncbi:MAG: aminoacyl-tRNA hydrolase [Clostridiales bacterium]|nr:aminoacyl-tRNA hydrolase [Clostridiales bacterium]
MKLIVGLGNPDRKYERTYHNVGFRAVEKFADVIGACFTKRMCDGVVAESYYNGQKLLLLKPMTYMNLSGIAIRQIMQKFKIAIEDVFVFVDDIDLPLGKIRFRESGSAGTHNGLKSIVNELGDTNFKRIKIGVGRDEKFVDLADFVLSRIPDDKLEIIDKEIEEGIELLKSKLN